MPQTTDIPGAGSWKRNIALFLGGQCLSLFGSALAGYAIMWHITISTQSGSMMTISIICGILPTFFMSPLGGVWADRFNRKYLINIADGIIALTTLILALLFLAGFRSIWLLYACSVIRALGTGVQTPAVNALIPQLTPEQHLTRINGINGSIQSLTMLVCPMLSGVLLTVSSLEYIFFIDVITAAIGIAIVFFFVRLPPRAQTGEPGKPDYFNDLKAGFIYIGNHGYIKRFFLLCAFFMILAAPLAFLTPLQVTRKFGPDVWRLTAVEITWSLGMMLGGILISLWGGFKNRIYSMALACALLGLLALALGIAGNFWLYLGFMGAAGATMPLFNTPSMVMLQERVEPAYMGRVFGVFSMISGVVMPLGMLIFGPLGDAVSIDYLLYFSGGGIFLLSFTYIISKTLRTAGEKPAAKPD
ncbi:MAG: MFS transporter [Treponema sp.]|jgi:DHA3 family macrolide efflux protein-like MFS transporter|nr:MFS transporter [Treponema sp.]